MAHLATRRFTYWGQLGILIAFLGAGMMIGGLLSFIPLLGKMNLQELKGASSSQFMDNLLKPENATALRWMQFISTLFIFFLPPFFYALLCHKKPFAHLGFEHKVDARSVVFIILIMIAALPVVSMFQELTEMYPWSKSMLVKFKAAEDSYNKQVAVIARMNDFQDYIISMIMIAFLPAVFEEALFRGGIQNLLSRWFKMPVLAIIVTSIVFSAIHGSYLGFLSRFALGFVLGWMYYRTGNIWLNIIAHFFNNGLAVTVLYLSSKPGQAIDPSKVDDRFPLMIGVAGIAVIIGLFIAFERINKNKADHPGEEVLIPYTDPNNPFDTSYSTEKPNYN